MARGGRREGAGRPKGAASKRTRDIANAVADTGMTPLEYLISVFQNEETDEAKRIDAAKAAAPYCHPRLQPVDDEGSTEQKWSGTGAFIWQQSQKSS